MATSAILPLLAVVALWCIHFLDEIFSLGLVRYALLPRHVNGLVGIITSPLLHDHSDHLQHLWNNSVAVFMLGWSLMYFYPRRAGRVVLFVWLISGALVWLTGRENYHLGASGVVYGMASFLFVSGLLRKQRTLMALSMLVVFLYGSLLWGVLPLVPHISWESHLWGLMAGVLMAYRYRDVEPAVQDPLPVSFSMDDDDDDDIEDNEGERSDSSEGIHIVHSSNAKDQFDQASPTNRVYYDQRNTSSTGGLDTPPE